jgi:hypothetical protein
MNYQEHFVVSIYLFLIVRGKRFEPIEENNQYFFIFAVEENNQNQTEVLES